MKSLLRKLILPAVIIVLCITAFFLLSPLRYRAYTGDRIKGTISVSGADMSDVTFRDCDVRIKGDTAIIGINAREYGSYSFEMCMPDDTVIVFKFYQYNWWNVSEFDLDVNISDTVKVTGTASCINENGKKEKHKIDRECTPRGRTELTIISV